MHLDREQSFGHWLTIHAPFWNLWIIFLGALQKLVLFGIKHVRSWSFRATHACQQSIEVIKTSTLDAQEKGVLRFVKTISE